MQFGCKPCSVSVAFGVKGVEGPCCVFVGIGAVAGAMMPVELHFAQRVSGVRVTLCWLQMNLVPVVRTLDSKIPKRDRAVTRCALRAAWPHAWSLDSME